MRTTVPSVMTTVLGENLRPRWLMTIGSPAGATDAATPASKRQARRPVASRRAAAGVMVVSSASKNNRRGEHQQDQAGDEGQAAEAGDNSRVHWKSMGTAGGRNTAYNDETGECDHHREFPSGQFPRAAGLQRDHLLCSSRVCC